MVALQTQVSNRKRERESRKWTRIKLQLYNFSDDKLNYNFSDGTNSVPFNNIFQKQKKKKS